jgi:hypothetical protein
MSTARWKFRATQAELSNSAFVCLFPPPVRPRVCDARRSVGLAANLTLRIASASIRCRYRPGTSPVGASHTGGGRHHLILAVATVMERVWDVKDIVALIENLEVPAAKRGPYKKRAA